jgi:hypothetical protein
MFRALARWWAKRKYTWKQEVEAATNDLHAGLSLRLAAEKRAQIEQLNGEADAIEENIKKVDAEDAGKEITAQEKYESDRERREAEKIVDSKRQTAKAEEENAVGSEKAAKYFQGQAANNRTVADKIRAL